MTDDRRPRGGADPPLTDTHPGTGMTLPGRGFEGSLSEQSIPQQRVDLIQQLVERRRRRLRLDES